ncbi:P-loop containing nucleoside triphosphate hydrolase protein [Neocallimastix californiae]|jgi:ABC-type multidrug transport system ATPase subunit|uniref:p-loop containing nucleoside triphosphate hydrolase protein n=1 Tax=Neocallimastix californiae TaxID=1754190 RepID=A0A1Y2C6L2_9FUNG|nr:P-loop containing nucleoside triphosphate hydrolase protein [Neocallimastix californiae]|eukprot:ORY42681.1 P-loop containing nucleoside triphosphate hydrolase protein [Neocallimastix californiae]
MYIIEQFKVIFWKNWKIFKRSSILFPLSEILVTATVVSSIAIHYNENHKYEKEGSSALGNVYKRFENNTLNSNSNIFGFVFPKDRSLISETDFVNEFLNDVAINKLVSKQKQINIQVFTKTFNNEEELEDFSNKDIENKFLAGIIFGQNYLNYTIRIKGDKITDSRREPIENFGKSRRSEYFYYGRNVIDVKKYSSYLVFGNKYFVRNNKTEGDKYLDSFIPVQIAIDNIIINKLTNGTVKGFGPVDIGRLSKNEINYKISNEDNRKESFSGYAYSISFLFVGQMIHVIIKLMDEKESGLRDGLISVGANRTFLWLTWVVIYLPFSIVSILFLIIFDPPVIMKSINPLIFFSIMFFYAISVLEIVVIFCLLSKNINTVIILTSSLLCVLIKFNNLLYDLEVANPIFEILEKCISLLFSPVGISMSGAILTYTDNNNDYIGFNNFFSSGFGTYFVFIIIDVVMYFCIAYIIDSSEGWKVKVNIGQKYLEKAMAENISYALDIQEDPLGSECLVQVRNIYKIYKFKKSYISESHSNEAKLGNAFTANNNISFNVYKDEIFGILGHNGAGKSTLIQIMIGMITPDSGEVFYNGQAISKNKKEIHKQFGICLQNNNNLIKGFTVGDHFMFYSRLKGVKTDLYEWLEDIDLLGKEYCEVQNLSFGQKRKLCIGLAFIGNPKYVFLDEPTSGLDPLSRQKIWSLLLEKKKDRVIFMTTHYMDEADIITDRKLILNQGVIRCMGSSIYLKNHFQMRYRLEIETDFPKDVEEIIKYYVPETEYFNDKTRVRLNRTSKQIIKSSISVHIWKLPIEFSPLFPSLIKCIENEKQKGTLLRDFSVNAPRLEELFIQLDRENENDKDHSTALAIELPNNDALKHPNSFIKACRIARYRIRLPYRKKLYLFISIVLPMIILIVFLNRIDKDISEKEFYGFDHRELSVNMYKDQQWNYDASNSHMDSFYTPQILEQELPKRSVNSNNQKSNTTSISNSSLIFHSREEMEDIGKSITESPYYVSSISGNFTNNQYQFQIYYNESMTHGLPSTFNLLTNSILASRHINETIQVYTHPLSFFDLSELTKEKFYSVILISVCISLCLSFIGCNAVYERINKLLKQLQLNGISNKSYWMSLFISDYLWFLVSCATIIVSLIICHFSPLFFFNILLISSVFFVFSGIGCILFQYCVSFAISTKAYAFIIFAVINVFPTFVFAYTTKELHMENDSKDFMYSNFITAIIFDVIIPPYCFVRVFKNLISIGIEYKSLNTSISIADLLSVKNQISCHFIGAFIAIIVYVILLDYINRRNYLPRKEKVYEISKELHDEIEMDLNAGDEDVLHEYERVQADAKINDIPIKLVNLMKEYNDLKFRYWEDFRTAMQRDSAPYGGYHLSRVGEDERHRRIALTAFDFTTLGIDKCECFGILGPNGSGKTSLLNTVSFTVNQTAGDILYEGKNTLDRKENEITLGYCPQENTLWEGMTLYEHIVMFLYLRGLSHSNAKRLAKQFIYYCRLTPHINKVPSELSGGTRRKLNILIALCSSPSRVLLDEPSTGMDPSTRRYIWEIIKASIQQNQSSTIMTTHSMEEAELLCNRIAIMVNGKLQCIGSPEHLKIKFGHTYILDVHTKDIDKFQQIIVENYELFGQNAEYNREVKSPERVKYEIYHTNTSDIGRIFEIMEAYRDKHIFIDYSYSQTTLNEVFLNFARLKENIDVDSISNETII